MTPQQLVQCFARASVYNGPTLWPQLIKASYTPCGLYHSTDPHSQFWQYTGPLPLPSLQSPIFLS